MDSKSVEECVSTAGNAPVAADSAAILREVKAVHAVPPITEDMGRSWRQPSRFRIVIDPTHALMTASDFEGLAEYSCSIPGGVYAGKMWRRHDGAFDHQFLAAGGKPEWKLCWFGEVVNEQCQIHSRIILLSDGGAA